MMQYGLLSYEFKTHFNIGDYVQSIAAKQFLPRTDVFLNREELHTFQSDDPVYFICNGWFMFHPENWPPAPSLHPLFISFHINPKYGQRFLTDGCVDYLKQHGPIGCRDEQTLKMLEEKQIPAWNSGCLTLTLGRSYQHHADEQAPVLICDLMFAVPKLSKILLRPFKAIEKRWWQQYFYKKAILKKLLKNADRKVKIIGSDYAAADYPDAESRFKLADQQLKTYQN